MNRTTSLLHFVNSTEEQDVGYLGKYSILSVPVSMPLLTSPARPNSPESLLTKLPRDLPTYSTYLLDCYTVSVSMF